jgi:hypothetical protein
VPLLSDKLRRHDRVRAQPLDDGGAGAVLVDLQGGRCWELNRVGAEIWERLDGATTLSEIRDALAARYGVAADTIQADVLALTDALLGADLVQRTSYGDARVDALLAPGVFARRFALAALDGGGVLFDLESGAYFRLNAAATTGCAELQRAVSLDDAVAAIAARAQAPAPVIREQLRALAAEASAGTRVRHEPVGPFRYTAAAGGGYDLLHGARATLTISADGRRLALAAPLAELRLPLHEHVRAVAPKLLFLQGVTVLHGASCRDVPGIGPGVLGLCGASGAGKTTTARLLAGHRASPISEDLMVMGPDPARPAVFAGGEAAVHDWARAAATALERDPGAAVDATPLRDAS